MAKLNIDRRLLDHPEHFDDEIRAFRHSERYVPTALEQLLFELAAHRCTICLAPWLEIHHIDEFSEGGETKYDNLIVLCPNCHARVHQDGVPSKSELRHYKLKQEVAYELPIVSRLSDDERQLLAKAAALPAGDQVIFFDRFHQFIAAESAEAAIAECRKMLGLIHLQESGVVSVSQESCIEMATDNQFSVGLVVMFTGKGVKWLRYLRATGRVPLTP